MQGLPLSTRRISMWMSRSSPTIVTAVLVSSLFSTASAYTCDLAAASPFATGAFPTAGLTPAQLLAAAATYGSGPALKETTYTYTSTMDGATMRFDTDCSCWADYLANQFLPSAYAAVTKDRTVQPPVPRAANWTTYFASVGPTSSPWSQVSDLRTVQSGDVLAYKLPPGSTDTGTLSCRCRDRRGLVRHPNAATMSLSDFANRSRHDRAQQPYDWGAVAGVAFGKPVSIAIHCCVLGLRCRRLQRQAPKRHSLRDGLQVQERSWCRRASSLRRRRICPGGFPVLIHGRPPHCTVRNGACSEPLAMTHHDDPRCHRM